MKLSLQKSDNLNLALVVNGCFVYSLLNFHACLIKDISRHFVPSIIKVLMVLNRKSNKVVHVGKGKK